jgi:hypothetical protein
MEHVPAMSRDAFVPDTVQTVGVVEVRLTASPELAFAERLTLDPATSVPMAAKVMVWLVLWTVKPRFTLAAAA